MLIHQTDYFILEIENSIKKYQYRCPNYSKKTTDVVIDCDTIDLVITIQINWKVKKTKFNIPVYTAREYYIIFWYDSVGYQIDRDQLNKILDIFNDLWYVNIERSAIGNMILDNIKSTRPHPEYNIEELLLKLRNEVFDISYTTTNTIDNITLC